MSRKVLHVMGYVDRRGLRQVCFSVCGAWNARNTAKKGALYGRCQRSVRQVVWISKEEIGPFENVLWTMRRERKKQAD